MPAIAHLVPRFTETSTSGGISGGTIAFLVFIGLIPVLVLIWVVSWLMFCYPMGRTCWCTVSRKNKAKQSLAGMETPDASQDMLNEKYTHDVQRPVTTYRTESGSSSDSGRFKKKPVPYRPGVRLSTQSTNSNSTIAVRQEPKPFV